MSDLQEYISIIVVFLISVMMMKKIFASNKPKSNIPLPPSPRALPIIGHMHHLGRIPHQAFHKLSTKYGPLVYFFIGSKPCVLASSPEIAKEILKTNETNFLNRPKIANLDYLTYNSSDFATIPYGPHWKFMKNLCMTRLLGARMLEQFRPIRREETTRLLKLLTEKAELNEEVDIGAQLTRLTNNVISRMVLTQRCSGSESEADMTRKLVKELSELGSKFNFSESFWFCKNIDVQGLGRRLKDARDRFDEMMEKMIKEHQDERRSASRDGDDENMVKDILDHLLQIYEDENAEIRLTMENIKAFVMNIYGAGTDTSSITIEWGLAELINNPDVMAKARKEIDSVVGINRIVDESDFPNLPYLQAVIKEILRLHPTGPLIVRESAEECIISGYRIPRKTRLFVNVWSLSRDANHWENPYEFRPERFLTEEWKVAGKNMMLDVRGQHFHLLPFGSGRRSCPGATLALQFVPATLAAIIQCFDMEVRKTPVDMEEGPGLTLPRKNSLVFIPVNRIDPFPSI